MKDKDIKQNKNQEQKNDIKCSENANQYEKAENIQNKNSITRFLKNFPLIVMFVFLLFGMTIYDLATPDIEFSESQNKKLEQRPELDFDKFTSLEKISKELKKFCTDYNDYVKDQVAFSDDLIKNYGFIETAVFQKTKLNGILLGDENMMFVNAFDMLPIERTNYPKNLAALENFAKAYADKLSVIIAPTAPLIYPENVPENVPMLDIGAMLDETLAVAQNAGANVVDVRETFAQNKDEYIYYRTDHHWTTLGAYYAYAQYCESLGLEPLDISAIEAIATPDFYGTHYAKARVPNTVADTISYYPFENEMTVFSVKAGKLEAQETTGLYNTEKLETTDKYATFLHGNNGFSRIDGDGNGKILVVKDSYANSFVPFLTANFSQIDVVDLRDYGYGLDIIIEENSYDQILVLYNIDTFKADMRFANVGVRG